jgi:tetratricopeptide (TPR) repeat protein
MDTQRSRRLVSCVLTAAVTAAFATGCDNEPSKKDTGGSQSPPTAAQPDGAVKSSDAARDATPPSATTRDPHTEPDSSPKSEPKSEPRPKQPATVAKVPQIDMSKLSPTTRAVLAKLQQMVQDAPGSASRLAELGTYYFGNGFPLAAAECFEQAVKILPRSMQFRYLLGLCYDAAGDPALALEAYEKALELGDDYPALHVLLADYYIDSDRARAEALFRRASVLDAKDALAHQGLGRCAMLNGDYEAALKHFARAAAIAPTFGAAHGAMAEALRKLGREEEAARHDDKAAVGTAASVTNDPIRFNFTGIPRSEAGIAKATIELADAGRIDLAVKNLERAIQVGLGGAPVRWALGKVYMRQQRFAEAMAQLQEALKTAPDDPRIKVSLSLAMVELGLHGEAETIVQRLMAEHPDNPGVRRLHGVLLAARGERDAAMETFQDVLQKDPTDAAAHYLLGDLLLSKGNRAEATDHLRRAVMLAPRDPRARFILGRALAGAGDNAGAEAQWREALKTLPTYEDARMSLAGRVVERGDRAEAARTLREGLTHAPESAPLANGLAWILAVSKDDSVRNGPEALKWARLACEKTNNAEPQFLDTLAAAYAEGGKFAEAIETMESAIKLAATADQQAAVDGFRSRLKLYQTGQCFRE